MKTRTLMSCAALAALLGLAGTASATTLNQVLDHNALAATRLAAAAAQDRLSPVRAAALEQRTARLYAEEAHGLAGRDDAALLQQLGREQRALLRTEAHARAAGAVHVAAMERTHMRVAALRQAEQQQWLAREFRRGQIDQQQVAQFEAAQSRIARLQASLDRRGAETVDQALQVQHLQDVQDWAIRTGHATA
jgi:hypothetical protein